MTNPRNISIPCLLFFFSLSLLSCVAPTRESVSRGQQLSVAEQTERTRTALQEISLMSEGSDREKIRPQMEAAYIDIIKRYPESQLVHECYEKLMVIYLMEYEPPSLEKAELLHDEFVRRYPASNARNIIDDTLADAYYRSALWQKLMKLYAPAIKRFIEKREIVRPWEMFMYSEAKFHLGDMAEARKGYNIVILYFPNSAERTVAKRRLDEIAEKPRDIQTAGTAEHTPIGVETIDSAPQRAFQEVVTEGSAFPEQVNTSETPPPRPPVPPEGKNRLEPVAPATHEKTTETPLTRPPVPPAGKNRVEPVASAANEKTTYSLQLGLFGNENNAISLTNKMKEKGYDVFILKQVGEDKKVLFRVLLGRFREKKEAAEYAKVVLHREGMKTMIYQEKEAITRNLKSVSSPNLRN